MSDRATAWSLTINNPTEADEEDIARARQKGWKVDGQLEKGENGTPHYQLILKTPQVRFSAVKKAFPRSHIQIARNVAALETYVHKDKGKVSDLPSSSEMYPTLSKLWERIYDDLLENDDMRMTKLYTGETIPEIRDEWSVLDLFDWSCERLIRKGYHVESMASNPQNRTAFKKFANALMVRVYRSRTSQTDRQTDDALGLQEIIVPTIHTNDQEGISQKDESPPSSPSPSSPDQPTPPSHP